MLRILSAICLSPLTEKIRAKDRDSDTPPIYEEMEKVMTVALISKVPCKWYYFKVISDDNNSERNHSEISALMSARLIAAFDLMDFGIQLMHQNIRRALPDAAPEVIDAHLHRWLIEQPKEFLISSSINSNHPTT